MSQRAASVELDESPPKSRRKFNPYCTFSEEVVRSKALRELKRASCNGGNNSFTGVSIIRRSYYVTLKN